jgi:hypothetical protein
VKGLIVLGRVKKGEEFKAPRYASAAVTRNYITICDIIPNSYKTLLLEMRVSDWVWLNIRNISI